MFFYLSKLFWFVAQPTNALVLIAMLGVALLVVGRNRAGRWLAGFGALGLLAGGLLPIGSILLRPLEDRFPQVADAGRVDGVIILGGAIGATRGMASLNDNAARMTETVALARRHPTARIAFTGGDASLMMAADTTEAGAAAAFLESLGVARERLILEDKSRNTRENAQFLKPLIHRGAGERWLLVTSAYHMPRSVGVFRAAGHDVIPYPVDFATRGDWRDIIRINRSFSHGLARLDLAVKEWIGLIAYRIAGYTPSLLPGPEAAPEAAPRR
jgi:uncharacterized SAM-binding protein YcdF (DUF218 family)